MKRLLWILLGCLSLLVMLGLLFFSGAIYDAEKKHTVETFFFEPNLKSSQRISVPVSAADIPNNFLRDKLIERFINEYFYVIPDINSTRKRVDEFRNSDGTMTGLFWQTRIRPSARNIWQKNVGPDIIEMANNKCLRFVKLLDVSESESGYLIVRYELVTWTKPNDVLALPERTEGQLLLNVTTNDIEVMQTEGTLENLKDGNDPVSAFNFQVREVLQD